MYKKGLMSYYYTYIIVLFVENLNEIKTTQVYKYIYKRSKYVVIIKSKHRGAKVIHINEDEDEIDYT